MRPSRILLGSATVLFGISFGYLAQVYWNGGVSCKSMGSASAVTLAMNPGPLQTQFKALQNVQSRFCVIEIKGESSFPHANQATFMMEGMSQRTKKDSDAVSVSPAHYLLVVDRLSNELFFYSKIPLWRMDTGGIDHGMERLWFLSAEKAMRVDSYGAYPAEKPQEEMWSPISKSLFIDLLQFSPSDALPDQIKQIFKQAEKLDFGESGDSSAGTRLVQRVVPSDDSKVVINNTISGQLLTAVTVNRVSESKNEFECKAIVYFADKPMETFTGALTLQSLAELPESVSRLIDLSRQPPPVEDVLEEELAEANSDTSEDAASDSKKSDGGWKILLLVSGSVAVLVVLMFSVFSKSKGENNEK